MRVMSCVFSFCVLSVMVMLLKWFAAVGKKRLDGCATCVKMR